MQRVAEDLEAILYLLNHISSLYYATFTEYAFTFVYVPVI